MNYINNYDFFRSLVVGLDVNSPLLDGTYIPVANFDNAATTPSFNSVLKSIVDFSSVYSSIHRGKGYKSMLSSDIYEHSRDIVKHFVNADQKMDTVIYTKNTTDSINTLAYVLSEQKDDRDIVISTWMEHAANDLPWRSKFKVEYVELDNCGRLLLDDLEKKLKKHKDKVKLVTVCGASNVTGYVNPIYEVAKLAHKYGVEVLVDGAQLVPHAPFDMKPFGACEHIDYLAFSGHKMYAPFGTGILIGPKKTFNCGCPCLQGGSAICLVTHKHIEWEEPPQKDEAGTPNLMGVIALIAAINTLKSVGMDNVYRREKMLYDYALNKIINIPDLKLQCNPETGENISIIPFNIDGIHHRIIAAILSYEAGIAVRTGFFCSHPYCERLLGYSEEDMEKFFKNEDLPLPGMVRVSFGLYNDFNEIDRLIYALNKIAANKKYYIAKYSNNSSLFRIDNSVK